MISLVVPVYNMKKLLPRCMDTLLHQEGSYEIVMIDDGSTDGSSVLCDQYAAEYPALVRVVHKKNGGLSSARNAGMDAANGDYVIFPDPDDWVEPDYVKRLTELQESYMPQLVCVSYYIEFDTKQIPAHCNGTLGVMSGEEAQKALLQPPYLGGFAWCKLYQMQIIRKYNLRFLDDVGTTEDLDFAYRYLKHCTKVCFDSASRLYHYYQRSGAATNSGFSTRKIQSIRTYEKIIDDTGNSEIRQAAEAEACNTAINLIWMNRAAAEADLQAEKVLHQTIRKYHRSFFGSKQVGKGRKIQGWLALYVPSLYVKLKNKVHGKGGEH